MVTVRELLKLCEEQIILGNADKNIVISDDEEGNGFRPLDFGFTVGEVAESILEEFGFNEDVVILG